MSCTKAQGIWIWGVGTVAATVPQGRYTGWKEAESCKADIQAGKKPSPARQIYRLERS